MNHLYKFFVLLGIFLVLGISDLEGCPENEGPVMYVRVAPDTRVSQHLKNGVSYSPVFKLEFFAKGGDVLLLSLPVDVVFYPLGEGIERVRATNEAGDLIAGPVNFSEENRAVLEFGDEGFLIPDGQSVKLDLRVDVASFPYSISGSMFALLVKDREHVVAEDRAGERAEVRLLDEKVIGNWFSLYRTIPWMGLNPNSPDGSSVPGHGQDVLRVDLFADIFGQHLEVNALAFQVRGNATLIGIGGTRLYKSTDLSDPLAVVQSREAIAHDATLGSGHEHSNTKIVASQGAFNGIPIGSIVRIRSGMEEEYFSGMFVVEGVSGLDLEGDVAMTFSPPLPRSIVDGDRMFYRPLQPCENCEDDYGMLYFGTMTRLLVDLASGETEIWVADIHGFSVGDVLYPRGYSASGELLVRERGCEVTAFFEAVQGIEMTPCYLTGGKTIDASYIPIEQFHVSPPMVTDLSRPLFISAQPGWNIFHVRGDTTGAQIDQTLQLNMEASGFHWNDGVSFDVLQPEFNKEFPISGGVLRY